MSSYDTSPIIIEDALPPSYGGERLTGRYGMVSLVGSSLCSEAGIRDAIDKLTAKLLEFEDRDELPTGAIVQVIEPAADGTVGMVGMIGIVVPFEDGEVCDIPDAGGVPVYFNWPDDGLHGRIARSRLRVVGMTSFVPVGPWKHGGIVTVEDDRIVRKDGSP